MSMRLSREQKDFIKKHIWQYSPAEIATHLGISEREIHDWLKKRWRPEKYQRYLNRFSDHSLSEEAKSFNFARFLQENRLVLVFLTLLVFVSYLNSLGNGFVSDDIAGYAKNENIGKFSSIFEGPLHFSLPAFFQFVAYHLGGLHPFTFRILNIFSHIGVVILIFLILSLMARKRTAIIAATLFAVHPILTESISWISGGLYSFYSFFFLFSFLFYLLSKNNRKYLYYSIAFYILSLLSSEKAVVLFLVFILYEMALGSLCLNWKKILPFLSISVVILFLYVGKVGYRIATVEAQTYQTSDGMYNPFIQIPIAIASYLKLIFWPQKLSLYQTEMTFSWGQYLICLFVFLVYLGAIIWSWFKNKTVFFWLTFFPITLLPTLTPFKISWIVAERYVYLGTLGIIVLVAMFFDKLSRLNENAKMITYFFLIIITVSLSVRTIVRNMDWKNEDTLWFATAKVAPSGQQIHNNLGDVYSRQGNMEKAIEEFKKAIEINPNYADAYHNLAHVYDQIGQNDQAIQYYQKALEINPNLWQSYQNIAAIYFNAGQYDLALENIKKAIDINPQNQQLQQNLEVIEENIKKNQ